MSDGGRPLERAIEPTPPDSAPRRRFVVLLHDHPVIHWDFLLEDGETLRTWRLPNDPCQRGVMPAEEIAPHRRLYLDYEGPVSGGRGTVRRVGAGIANVSETSAGLIVLDALLLAGALADGAAGSRWERFELTRIDGTQWQFQARRRDNGPNREIPGAGGD